VRDVRDWNKYVDTVGKAVSKRVAVPAKSAPAPPPEKPEEGAAPRPSSVPPRTGRGPRKEETREELLSRLLDPTLTLEETARILEVCPTTVRRYTNKGILPHLRSAGNQRQFKLSSVLAFKDGQKSRGAEAAPEPNE